MIYRFKSSLLGNQILQVSEGKKLIESTDSDGTPDGHTYNLILWRNADRYEAESLLGHVSDLEREVNRIIGRGKSDD